MIQEALVYEDIRTTENCLDSFGNDSRKEIAGKLTAFKKRIMNDEKHCQSLNMPADSRANMEPA